MRKKPCLRREFYNLAHFLSFLLNSDNDTQISGFRKGVRSSDKFSVFSLSYFPIFAIFLLFANWMTTIVTELNQRLILKKPNTSSSQNWIFTFSIYQISGQQFLRVLIGSRNLEYPWTVLPTERKMARRFAKVSEEEIVAINEAAFFIHLIW